MDLKTLFLQQNTVIHQQKDNGILLEVKETAQYRWFQYGGSSTQSLMNKNNPEQLLMPVYQSLLLFLLFKKQINKVLTRID